MEQRDLHWRQLSPSHLNALVRGEVDEAGLQELADSLREHQVIEPLVVMETGDGYQIIAGERRWRAAKLLGDDAPLLPCIVREPMDELEQLVLMGVENLQRRELTPIAEGRYYAELQRRGLDVGEIVRRTGRIRSRVEQRLRLTQLHPDVQAMIARDAIPASVDRELSRIEPEEQAELCRRMTGQGRVAIARAVGILIERKEREDAARIAGDGRNGRGPGRPRKNCTEVYEVRFPGETLDSITPVELELAVRATCAACEVHAELPDTLKWDDVRGAMEDQCDRCEVRDIREACRLCPMVDFLRAMRKMISPDRGEPVGPGHLYRRGVVKGGGRYDGVHSGNGTGRNGKH